MSKAILYKRGAEGYYNVGEIRVACGAGVPTSENYGCKGQHKAVELVWPIVCDHVWSLTLLYLVLPTVKHKFSQV